MRGGWKQGQYIANPHSLVNGLHLYGAFFGSSGHPKRFTILAKIHPFMHTFTHQRWHQPCKVPCSGTSQHSAEPGIELATLRLPANLIYFLIYCHPSYCSLCSNRVNKKNESRIKTLLLKKEANHSTAFHGTRKQPKIVFIPVLPQNKLRYVKIMHSF